MKPAAAQQRPRPWSSWKRWPGLCSISEEVKPDDEPGLRLFSTVLGTRIEPGDGSAMDQQNALTSAELKRRGIAAIERALQHGPVHLLKRNRSAAVVLSEQHYRQLQLQASRAPVAEASALQWLLALPPSTNPRSKAEIDAELTAERDW